MSISGVDTLAEALDNLSTEARELYLDSVVPVLTKPPSALTFCRDYVSQNKPVIIQNALTHWGTSEKWTSSYLRKTLGSHFVTVSVTPNGFADAVTDGKFVMPEERQMSFSDFLDILENPLNYNGIFYIQKQNSNLTDEFSTILKDIEPEIPWGSEAFGVQPDTVNFWMGDGRAVTSMHKDHYENLYCVVKGWKKFLLIPPTDAPYVPYEIYQSATFIEKQDKQFEIQEDKETGQVPWIAIDPLKPDLQKYPQYAKARPIEVTVQEGEMLYLPSMWFHHVRQSHGCIAVNYWYDMQYDIKYNYYNFVQNIAAIHRKSVES